MGKVFIICQALACMAISMCVFSTAIGNNMTMNSTTQCRTWCGNQRIKYPFGFQEGCGRPEFQLNCNENDNSIELRLNSKVFTVIHLDFGDSKMIVRDGKMSDCNGLKQEDPNFRLDWRGTNYSITESTVLLLNCLAFDREMQVNLFNSDYDCKSPACVAFITSCLMNGITNDAAVPPTCCQMTSPDHLDLQPLQCQSYTSAYSPGKSMYDATNWNYGLVLEWDYPLEDLQSCMDCQRIGGVCGYNVSDLQNSFLCICNDGNSTDRCQDCLDGSCSHAQLPTPPGKENRKEVRQARSLKGLAIGLVVAVATLIIPLSAFCHIFFQRMKKKKAKIEAAETESSFTREEANNQLLPMLLQHINGTSSSMILYSYDELKEATDSFSESRHLGDGGYGTVYLAKFHNGGVAAVKTLNYQNQRRVEQFHNEVRILGKTRHPNLVELLGFSVEGRELMLVYELLPNGTLEDHLLGTRSVGPLPWGARLSIAVQVAEALSYLHTHVSPPIIHRDVKSSNILLDHALRAKLADFGLCRVGPGPMEEASHVSTAPQGTLGFLDPEYHRTFRLTDKSDVYSFGVVLLEMISGRRAVEPAKGLDEINLCALAAAKMDQHRLQEIVDPFFNIANEREIVHKVAELALRCLASSGKKRPAMTQVLGELMRIRDGGKLLLI